MIHVRLLYRITAFLGILAATTGLGACDGDATRTEVAALRAELAEVRKTQEQLQQAVESLQKAGPGRRGLARTAGQKPERDVVRIIPTGGSPRLGSEIAGATLVLFADFQCAFCQAAAGLPRALAAAYPDDVQVVFKNYPLARHTGGLAAARAGWAAQQQGKFWEMYDLIYGGDIRAITPEMLRGYAEKLGLDMERYEADAASPKAAQQVAFDKAMGRRFRIGGTPTYFVNGRLVAERTPAAVQAMVAQEIAKVKPKAAPAAPDASPNGS